MVVSIALAIVFYGLVNNWWGGASQIFALDTTGTKVYMEQSTGSGRIILVMKNAGTATLQLSKIKIVGTKNSGGSATICFGATPMFNYTGDSGEVSINGELWGSASSVAIANKALIIPAGQTASIEIWFDGTAHKMNEVFDVGRSYHATIYPLAQTGRVYDFVITIEPA
ncbi:MAG: hypothetical protein QXD78_06410 [Candidatus Bathyarchaeia archaeon]